MSKKGVTAEIMAEIDKRAQEEYGIPQEVLMENAGRSVAEAVISDTGVSVKPDIAVLCGRGNNGGDGFVAARYLASAGAGKVTIFLDETGLVKKGASFHNFNKVREMKLPVFPVERYVSLADSYTVIVDAVFGTGFHGELPDIWIAAAKKVNSLSAFVYAVDIPSGLDATTGIAAKNTFKAFKTITFGLPKAGFFINDGPALSGRVIVAKIGFPQELLDQYM